MSSSRPPRILFVTRTPWQQNLGAARVYVELAEELRAQGHQVAKFSWEDAFPQALRRVPNRRQTAIDRVWYALAAGRNFAVKARSFIRGNSNRFDVVDANHTDLPYSKSQLGFSGLLVARSVAFVPAYKEFSEWAEKRWPEPLSLRGLAHRALFLPQQRQNLRNWPRALRYCDLINVSSRDDEQWAKERLGWGDKVAYFPFGLSAARLRAFAEARAEPAERLASGTVAFIGTWNPRKGARDWPTIVEKILGRRPSTRFRMLGTDMAAEVVLRDFSPAHRGSIEVVQRFESDALPELLSGATVGAFPGYLESFGFGVLELLAAGLPTVLYDAPGPRDIAGFTRRATLVERGDVAEFAHRVVTLLEADRSRYEDLSDDAHQAARHFKWETIARETAEAYLHRLSQQAALPR